MANILYYSVHESLEYDESILLSELGHNVFSLGVYSPLYSHANPFRPPLDFGPEVHDLARKFVESGSSAKYNNVGETKLTPEFLDYFDIILVTHDLYFITANWEILRGRRVVWRTIGQSIDHMEGLAKVFRTSGLGIVRWSWREVLSPGYVGHDAIIPGYKDESQYGNWNPSATEPPLTFCNGIVDRYPAEYAFLMEATEGIGFCLGGGANPGIPNAIGLVTFDEQRRRLSETKLYLYFHGAEVPYTLNFIEAWMTGAPVMIIGRDANLPGVDTRYNVLSDIVIDGVNGFVVTSPVEARERIAALMATPDKTANVSHRGRETAIAIFGKQRALRDWERFIKMMLSR